MRPRAVVFDVIETLFTLDPVDDRLATLGLPPGSQRAFLAELLRDAMALEVAGPCFGFRALAERSLAVFLASRGVTPDESKVASVLAGFEALPARPDVAPCFAALAEAGVTIATLSNGSVASSEKLLDRAGLRSRVAKVLSVETIGHWKPHRDCYLYAARELDCGPGEIALVAAHAWDVHGARRAGLHAGWVSHLDARYPRGFEPPDAVGKTLDEVVRALLG